MRIRRAYRRKIRSRLCCKLAVERWGGVDILINNAGWSKRTPHHLLDELTEEIWDRTLNTNLRGTFYCTRAAAPLLKQRPGASVINVASIAPYRAGHDRLRGVESRGYQHDDEIVCARVLAPDVRVNAIAPGIVETRFAGWPPEHFVRGAAASPLKRNTTADECGELALFLAADATSITGETFRIDSGNTALR